MLKGKMDGWNKKGPLPIIFGSPRSNGNWLDHLSCDPKEGKYYSEPYNVSCRDFLEFGKLEKEGWIVEITGKSIWNPGSCVLITIYRK